MRVCGLLTLAIVWAGVIKVATTAEMRRYVKSVSTGQVDQSFAATTDALPAKPRPKGRRKKNNAPGKGQKFKPFYGTIPSIQQKRSTFYYEEAAHPPLTSGENAVSNTISLEVSTTPGPPISTLLTLAPNGGEPYTATAFSMSTKHKIQNTGMTQKSAVVQSSKDLNNRVIQPSVPHVSWGKEAKEPGKTEIEPEDEIEKKKEAKELKREETEPADGKKTKKEITKTKETEKERTKTGDLTENTKKTEKEKQAATDDDLDSEEYPNVSNDEELKNADIEGRQNTLDLAHELSTATDAETKDIESRLTSEAQKVINQADCIDQAVLKLKDMTGRAKMAQAASESAKSIEASIEEMEQQLEKDKAGLQVAESQEKDGILKNLANEPTIGGKDVLDAQVDKAEKELEENRDSLREKEQEADCETTHDIKTFEKEMVGEAGTLPSDPEARATKLKKEELLATTADARANVENKAADMDLDDAVTKVDNAEDSVKDAEVEFSNAKEELNAGAPHIGGDETPCEDNKALVTQSTMAASEARDAQEKLEKTKKDLEEAESLAKRAREEAKQATEDEELETAECQTEEKRPETEKKTEMAKKRSNEIEERARQLRARVSELSTAVAAEQLTAEHEAIIRLKRQEEDCQTREATNAQTSVGQYKGSGCSPPPPKCSSAAAEHAPAVVTTAGGSESVDTKMEEAAKVDRLENKSIDAEPQPMIPRGPGMTSFIRKRKILKDIQRHAYNLAI